jgi:ankyrin repeat protein
MSSNRSRNAFASIKALCGQRETRPESELIVIVKSIIRSVPTVLHEREVDNNRTLLHYAAMHRSVEFAKVLVESDGGVDCVGSISSYGELPFHIACSDCNVELAKYSYSLYPEAINIARNSGQYALHYLMVWDDCNNEEDCKELTRFLLPHNQGAASTPDSFADGDLPLHIACEYKPVGIVKLVYDAYPEAVHRRNKDGETPLDVARGFIHAEVVAFLEAQLELERQAHENVEPD